MKKEKPRSIFDDYETSIELERDGAWVTTSKGYEFKIARVGGLNVEYSRYLVEQSKLFHGEILALEKKSDEELTPENTERLGRLGDNLSNVLAEGFAKYILRGWRGIYDRDGKELPFNEENAIRLMKMNELYTELYQKAQDFATFLVSNMEERAKN